MMAVRNYELTEVLNNLNDYLDSQIEKLDQIDFFVFDPDRDDYDQIPLADIPQNYVPNDSGNGTDQDGQFESDGVFDVGTPLYYEFYPENSGFSPDNGVFYPDKMGLYPCNSGWSALYFGGESQYTGGDPLLSTQLSKVENKAIDIINPDTGEKLQFL